LSDDALERLFFLLFLSLSVSSFEEDLLFFEDFEEDFCEEEDPSRGEGEGEIDEPDERDDSVSSVLGEEEEPVDKRFEEEEELNIESPD
jgi:hypothetical protein